VTIKFLFVEVSCPQRFKNTKMSTIDAVVSVYRGHCLALSCYKERKGKFWSSSFKPCGIWHYFDC